MRQTGWAETVRAALDHSRTLRLRRASARKALGIAAERAPFGAQHCHSLTALARVSRENPEAALAALEDAARVCAMAHGPDDIRIARIRLDQARLHYLAGRPSTAWGMAEGLEAAFAAHGQEQRLLLLYDLQAAVLAAIQQPEAGSRARRRAAEWRTFAEGPASADAWRPNGH